MINYLHALIYRPEKGWDPVPAEHAERYAAAEWSSRSEALVDQIEHWLGGFQNKRVLDLGGGPGQYSVAFAQRGAQVTWHDISRNYQRLAQARAHAAGVEVHFSLGYLEEAKKFLSRPFDFVFNRICWYYCKSDRAFARLFYALIEPGGAGYVDTNTSTGERMRGIRKMIYFLNNRLAWKIGHPFPPHGRIARLLQDFPIDSMILDYTAEHNDRIFFVKSQMV
jgi:SAM-dependent methyltransferase